jgi:hypothetical protein
MLKLLVNLQGGGCSSSKSFTAYLLYLTSPSLYCQRNRNTAVSNSIFNCRLNWYTTLTEGPQTQQELLIGNRHPYVVKQIPYRVKDDLKL